MSFQQKLAEALERRKQSIEQKNPALETPMPFTKADMHIILCMVKDLEAQMTENYNSLSLLKEFLESRNQPGVVFGADLYGVTDAIYGRGEKRGM